MTRMMTISDLLIDDTHLFKHNVYEKIESWKNHINGNDEISTNTTKELSEMELNSEQKVLHGTFSQCVPYLTLHIVQ